VSKFTKTISDAIELYCDQLWNRQCTVDKAYYSLFPNKKKEHNVAHEDMTVDYAENLQTIKLAILCELINLAEYVQFSEEWAVEDIRSSGRAIDTLTEIMVEAEDDETERIDIDPVVARTIINQYLNSHDIDLASKRRV